jgi:hypothetical protein
VRDVEATGGRPVTGDQGAPPSKLAAASRLPRHRAAETGSRHPGSAALALAGAITADAAAHAKRR